MSEVAAQIAAARSNADTTLASALAAVQRISVPRFAGLNPQTFNVDYSVNVNRIADFNTESFNANPPPDNLREMSVGDPSEISIVDPDVGTAPLDTVGDFEPSFQPAPFLSPIQVPEAEAALEIDIPVFEDPEYPEVPEFLTLRDNLEAVALQLPTFSATAPTAITDDLDPSIELDNERYSSSTLTALRDQITDVFSTGTNLPQAIADALFDREIWRQDKEATRARRQVAKEFAARGFSRPPGALSQALLEIEKTGLEARSRVNLEQYVERWRQEVELIKEYTALGIQLEQALIEEHNQFFTRAARFAEVKLNASVAIFDARIKRYNLQIEVFRAEIEQYRAEVERELSKLKVLEAEVEIERVKADGNRSIADRYRTEVEAANLRIAAYNAQLSAAETQTRINSERVNQFRADIEAYRAQIEAAQLEIRSFAELAQVENVKANIFGTRVQVYAERVRAFQAETEAAKLTSDVGIQRSRLQLEAYQARVAKESAEKDQEIRIYEAEIESFRAEIAEFQARIEQNKAKVQAGQSEVEILVAAAKAQADISLASAQILSASISAEAEQAVRAMIAAAEISGQLAASAQNAVNASASLCETPAAAAV